MPYASTQFHPAPSPGAAYSGTPEIHDAGGSGYPHNQSPTSPARRFSGFSENAGNVSPVGGGPGVGGFYNGAVPISTAGTGGVGGFNPALGGPSGSPTAQRFSYQPSTGPSTPLTANSEQGLLAHAQAQAFGQGQGSSSGRMLPVPSEVEKGQQW